MNNTKNIDSNHSPLYILVRDFLNDLEEIRYTDPELYAKHWKRLAEIIIENY